MDVPTARRRRFRVSQARPTLPMRSPSSPLAIPRQAVGRLVIEALLPRVAARTAALRRRQLAFGVETLVASCPHERRATLDAGDCDVVHAAHRRRRRPLGGGRGHERRRRYCAKWFRVSLVSTPHRAGRHSPRPAASRSGTTALEHVRLVAGPSLVVAQFHARSSNRRNLSHEAVNDVRTFEFAHRTHFSPQ